MAHRHHHDTGLSWEWDSVLLLSNPVPLPAPSLEADGSSSVGLRLRPTPVSSSVDHAGHYHRDSRRGNETASSHVHTDSRSSDTQSKDSKGDRGRDPRLDCPNFLAGRVPCACTDNDDDDSGVSRKRSKPIPRCQVAACGAELIDLKGYHQRHRVCLRCAHATRVILRDQPHRYCQQCGKFHPICDFDEGKRSCRRKLEKHNNRRRRKAGEDCLPASEYGDTDTPIEGSPGDGGKMDALVSEGDVKESTGEKPSLDVDDTFQTSGIPPEEKLIVAVKVSESSGFPEMPADVPVQTFEPSVETGVHGNEATAEQKMIHSEISQHGEIQLVQEPIPLAQRDPSESHHEGIHVMSRDDFALHGSLHPEPGVQLRREHEEESLLALLMDENGATETSQFSENDSEHLLHNPMPLWVPSSPSGLSKEVGYSSPVPTGRISFKLYDWNPGDFPRQLRQQVMEWLANMPVDLEGYIRSGCTILTIFVAMPQSVWDDLSADWASSVLKLVKAEKKGVSRFWSSGYLIARLNDQEVHLNNGDLARPFSRKVCESPALAGVRPLCLEAGREEEVTILGQNLRQPQSRLLVSFDGKYVVKDAYESRMQGETEGAVTRVCDSDNREDATLFVRMPAFPSTSSGTAYVEVEYESGISNYIPVLVAEKDIVDEVRSLEKEMDRAPPPTSCCRPNAESARGLSQLSQRRVNSLLNDLGWVLKSCDGRNFESDLREEILELHLQRLRRLLFFGVKRSWYNMVKKVLQLSSRAGLLEKVGILDNGLSAPQVAVLCCEEVMAEHLICCTESLCAGSSSQSKFWWNLGFPGPNGFTILHLVALQPVAQGLRDLLLKKKDGAALWNQVRDHRGQTPQDYFTRKKLSHKLDSDERDVTIHTEGNTEDEDRSETPNNFLHDDDAVVSKDDYAMRLEDETRVSLPRLPHRPHFRIVTSKATDGMTRQRQRLPVSSRFLGHENVTMYISSSNSSRKRRFQLVSSVTILLVCAGLCVMVQRPHEVTTISLSLQRCLLGLESGSL